MPVDLNWPLCAGVVCVVLVTLVTAVLVVIQRRALRVLSAAADASKEEQIDVALRWAKRSLLPDSNAKVKAARRQLNVLRGKYTDYEALLQILNSGMVFGGMKLVRGSWLMDPRNIRRLRRQQELPKAAFWNPEELRSQLNVVSIVAMSYCWLHPVHPDPHGKHLRTLQRAINLRLRLRGPGQVQDLAIFLDFASLPQHGEQGDESDPIRGACRSESEEIAYKNASKHVDIPYASQLVETWIMTYVPADEPRKYMQRGWPFFEQAVSHLIKPAPTVINIGEVFHVESWIDVHERGKIGRGPPLTPSAFKESLSNKSFSNGKVDQKFIEYKYAETFTEVVGKATTLWFADLGWTDADVFCFVDVFPFAVSLERLLLSENKLSKVGAEAVVRGSGRCPSLQYLDLSDNRISYVDCDSLLQIWQSFGKPKDGLRLAMSQRRLTGLSAQNNENIKLQVEVPAEFDETRCLTEDLDEGVAVSQRRFTWLSAQTVGNIKRRVEVSDFDETCRLTEKIDGKVTNEILSHRRSTWLSVQTVGNTKRQLESSFDESCHLTEDLDEGVASDAVSPRRLPWQTGNIKRHLDEEVANDAVPTRRLPWQTSGNIKRQVEAISDFDEITEDLDEGFANANYWRNAGEKMLLDL